MSDYYKSARQLAIITLGDNLSPTIEEIETSVSNAVAFFKIPNPAPLEQTLIRDLEASYTIWQEKSTGLYDYREHWPWLRDKKSAISWKFWDRYLQYLDGPKMSKKILKELDEVTENILENLEDPKRENNWDTRGMVVGSVQSGKTANYIGLICKAIDAGYKMIVVLAGLHNNLRSQTQQRIDEGVIGFDTQRSINNQDESSRIGVGRIPSPDRLIVHSLTSSADNGDFNRRVAEQINIRGGGDPVILVIKKNVSVLRNLIAYLKHIEGMTIGSSTERRIHGLPLLVIDDEADNASINTKAPQPDLPASEYDATAINRRIRELLNCFEQSAYVGYTATPFANIFINPETDHEILGEDLFPRNFIINLKAPSNHLGPEKLFGFKGDRVMCIDEQPSLPVIRIVDDFGENIPPKHSKDQIVSDLPSSLRAAIRTFIVSCAAKATRGYFLEHNSMLIHVTRYVDVQNQISKLVKDELDYLVSRIRNGDGRSRNNIRAELKELWEKDFIPLSEKMADGEEKPHDWSSVEEWLQRTAEKIIVRTINGTAGDALEYKGHPEGVSVIAIGGDKLSRGLTLEGLSVSYYLRTSNMYDTLLQMGRWFGYRDHYLDLCRLYTTQELIDYYRHITLCEMELRQEFDYMASAKLTPAQYGLKVRTHPAGLLITSLNKMRAGTPMEVSFDDKVIETYAFDVDDVAMASNFSVLEGFLARLGEPVPSSDAEKPKDIVWCGRYSADIIEHFLGKIKVHRDCYRVNSSMLSKYIKAQNEVGELTNWTVVLINVKSQDNDTRPIGGRKIGLAQRKALDLPDKTKYVLPNRRIVSQADEAIGLDETKFERAKEWTKQDNSEFDSRKNSPSGRNLRKARGPNEGLLLIYPVDSSIVNSDVGKKSIPFVGFALSFPPSDKASKIEYRVNKLYTEPDDEY